MTGLWPRGFLSLTAAMPLRVVEGASKFIEGASLYKTFTTGLSPVGKPYNRPAGEEMHPPFGGWRHHLPPHFVVGLWVLSYGAMSLQESIEPILPPA